MRSQMSEMVSICPISRAREQQDRRAVVGRQRGTAPVLAILAHNASRIARALASSDTGPAGVGWWLRERSGG